MKVTTSVPINTKARKPRLPEHKPTNFIENLNRLLSLLVNNTQTSQTTDLLSKEKVNSLCNKFSEFFNESAYSCNNYNNDSNTANNNKDHGSDTSVLSHVKHIITQRKCMLNTQALRRRLQWCPQAINSSNDSHDPESDNLNFSINNDDAILNCHNLENEFLKCINNSKNNKACSNDGIINEYIKATAHEMMQLYVAFFNLIFNSGVLSDSWLKGAIRPIYKNKGDSKSPENYRPITILSYFGKLFTSILNARLYKFLDAYNILEENQAGFRADYSTMDHIFVLNALKEIAKTQKKKLFCSFIDFSKAFDSVWRIGLWKKLLASNINGKCFQIILNMYKGIKSCVSYNGEQSSLFSSF